MTSPAADLARLRKTGAHTCPHCGRVFVALAAAKYCGAPCRMASAYQRRKAAKHRVKELAQVLAHPVAKT